MRKFRKSLRVVLSFLLVAAVMISNYGYTVSAEETQEESFGVLEEYSTYAKGSTLTDSFYYSDAWFQKDPAERNDALALASMQLTAAAVEADESGYGAAFLKDIGFTEIGFSGFSSVDPTDCCFTWGKKPINDGAETLLVIAVQSYSFDDAIKEKGWKQNFTINGDTASAEHYAFALAADQAVDEIVSLVGSGPVKIWITGQSRGGALANMIAAKLKDRLGSANQGIFAYTFESPATVGADAEGVYDYIHNYICGDDIVTRIPVWGMTRYGNTYELRTGETENALQEELNKLGSDAAGVEIVDYEDGVSLLVEELEARIPTRADYSKVRTDTFTDENDEEITVTYSYQEAFVHLMGVIFSGELSGLSGSDALDRLEDLRPAIFALAEGACMEESGGYPYHLYWKAAVMFRDVLNTVVGSEISLSIEDYYAFFCLIGPIVIDTAYEPCGDPSSDTISYIMPLMDIIDRVGSMTYSHHFDTLIARLKTLAPQPPLDDISIEISAPEADDAADKAPQEVLEKLSALNYDWIEAEAAWNSSDETLQADKKYYLNVTLKTVGHSISDDWSFLINENSYVGDYETTYEDGVLMIDLTWEFAVGESQSVIVSFDAGGYTEDPEAIEVPNGTALKYKKAPDLGDEILEKDGAKWRFGGWYAEDETPWKKLVVSNDMTVYARWIQVVDDIQVSFEIPEPGMTPNPPTVDEDAPYYIESYYFIDKDWEEITSIEAEGNYYLNIKFKLKDPEKAEFLLERFDEYYIDYVGSLAVNGEDEFGCYDSTNEIIEIPSFEFVVGDLFYEVVEGEDQEWIRGSEDPLVFVIKRSVDEDRTFDYFEDIMMDEEVLDPSVYTAEAGSVKITLPASYLESLENGKHTMDVVFEDGTASIRLSIRSEGEEESSEDSSDSEESDPDDEGEEDGEDIDPGKGEEPADPEIDPEPDPETDPKGEDDASPADEDTSEGSSADTGDASHTMIWVSLIGISTLGLIIIGFLKMWFDQREG